MGFYTHFSGCLHIYKLTIYRECVCAIGTKKWDMEYRDCEHGDFMVCFESRYAVL